MVRRFLFLFFLLSPFLFFSQQKKKSVKSKKKIVYSKKKKVSGKKKKTYYSKKSKPVLPLKVPIENIPLANYNKHSRLIDSLLRSRHEYFSPFLANPRRYKIQIIYTQIDRDKNNKPNFTQHNYYLDSTNYFYCASLVKLPVSILCLQKLNQLKVPGLHKNSIMITDSSIACHRKQKYDGTSANGFPSIAHHIKKMLLVSDNISYGRTYEFLTPDYIHTELKKRGYGSMRIMQRFDGRCQGTNNFYCNKIDFFNEKNELVYSQPESMAKKNYFKIPGTHRIGSSYLNEKNKRIRSFRDMSDKNYLHLQQINDILKWLVFYEYAPESKKFNISESDRDFLLKYMSMYPRESEYPKYSKDYVDAHKKYLIHGGTRDSITNDSQRIFNIVGLSLGCMIDCAYIVDFEKGTEFMLSAIVYANSDDIVNDGNYEYYSVGFPYLNHLGDLFLNYENQRKKKFMPDLREFEPKNLYPLSD
jgi:hypothetical protein